MDFFQRPGCRCPLDGVNHRALQNVAGRLPAPGNPSAERLCGGRDALLGRGNAKFEFELNVGANLVARQHRVLTITIDTVRKRTHEHFLDPVQDRKRQTSAFGHDSRTTKPGPHESGVQTGLCIIALEEPDRDNRNGCNQKQQDNPAQGRTPSLPKIARRKSPQSSCPSKSRQN